MLPVNMPKGYSAVHSSSSPITASSSLSSSSYYTSQQIPPSANQQQQAYRHKYRSRSKSFNWFKLKFSQMDMELALWQMLYLCISPRRVYRNIYYQKQTKNQWARDDPAFVVLLLIFLGIAALAYGIALRSVFGIPHLILKMVVVDFLIVGALVATGTWAFCNKFLLSHSTYAVEQRVEWAYAWDVHCNSFFPLFLLTYILQFFFIPIIHSESTISMFFGNTIYFIAVCYYCWITFLGYNALPFLKNTHVFLYPMIAFFFIYFVSLFSWDIALTVLSRYE